MKAVPATNVNSHVPEMIIGSTLEMEPSQQIYAKLFKLDYLRAETTGTMQVPLALWEERAFLVNKQTYVFFYGAFLSALLMMAAYNLCLFFIVKARSYLIYSLFIVCMVGVHASLDVGTEIG